MDENTATMKVNELREWLLHNDAGAMNAVIEINVNALDNASTDEMRDSMWAATRAVCGTVEVDGKKVKTAPVKRGRKQNPLLVASFGEITPQLTDAYTELVNHGIIAAITFPSARTGGEYTTEEAIQSFVDSDISALKRAFNADPQRWDGTLNKNNLPVLTPHPIVEKAEDTEDV